MTTKYTADAFAAARFATHPDGRIAHRAAPTLWASTSSTPPGDPIGTWMGTNTDMAADGWSPLDETRLPRVVTDEMVLAFWNAFEGLNDDLEDMQLRDIDEVRTGLAAALAAAPTTDEDARTYALEQIEQAQAETTEAVTRAEKAEQGLADLSERYREQGGALLRAEKERDEARESLREANETVKSLRSMTAREHLDAARDARETGYSLPKGATIPAGVPFWVKAEGEPWEFVPDGATGDLDTSPFPAAQYVTVDPPTPKRPEGARALDPLVLSTLREHGQAPDGETVVAMADFLAERGVRVTEGEAS